MIKLEKYKKIKETKNLNDKIKNILKINVLALIILFSFLFINIYAEENIKSTKYLEIEGTNAGNLENKDNENKWEAYVKKEQKDENNNKEEKINIKYTKRIYILIAFVFITLILYFLKNTKYKKEKKIGKKKQKKDNEENIF